MPSSDTVLSKLAYGGRITPSEWELLHRHNTTMVKDLTKRVYELEKALDRLTNPGGCGEDDTKRAINTSKRTKRSASKTTGTAGGNAGSTEQT